MSKLYGYVNKKGCDKMITIGTEPDEGRYEFVIWDALHGEFCGSGRMTQEEIDTFLREYNAKQIIEKDGKLEFVE